MPVLKKKSHMVDLLFTLALLCVFAASALLVVLIGANVYRDTARTMEKNYSSRTSLSYVAQKVRQGDAAGGIHLTQLNGSSALVLTETHGSVTCDTYIYYQDGSLTELLCTGGAEPDPALGQPVLELEGLQFLMEEDTGLITVTATEEGVTRRLLLCPEAWPAS